MFASNFNLKSIDLGSNALERLPEEFGSLYSLEELRKLVSSSRSSLVCDMISHLLCSTRVEQANAVPELHITADKPTHLEAIE